MSEVATALSHDIKGLIGTIGRKARILLMSASDNLEDRPNAILHEIIGHIGILYERTEKIRDEVRSSRIHHPQALAAEITIGIIRPLATVRAMTRGLSIGKRRSSSRGDELALGIRRLEQLIESIRDTLNAAE